MSLCITALHHLCCRTLWACVLGSVKCIVCIVMPVAIHADMSLPMPEHSDHTTLCVLWEALDSLWYVSAGL